MVEHESAIKKLIPRSKKFSHVAEELYRKNVELADTNRVLSLLRSIDDLMLSTQSNSRSLSQQLVQIINQQHDFNFVQLFLRPTVQSNMQSYALAAEIPDNLKKLLSSSHMNQKLYRHIQNSEVVVTKPKIDDILMAGSGTQISKVDMLLDIERVYVVPLRARGELLGFMVIGASTVSDHSDSFRLDLMTRLMSVVGVSIDSALLVEQLKLTNNKLKELDTAKDEFISMASHQLRTPLTTVKGYLSMVLEGDAGKISKTQHQFLDQAYGSAQRMVYLIADLLNVSRLSTGKFVIDAKSSNLATIVEQEIDQLQRHAQTRNVTLKYEKPKTFPTLELDETKIRQVIMNFTDNAIYYTPGGGTVNAKLSKTPKSIQFTVTDTGIGVPKALQHKLFTKFYRAENAMKARPDGTGLGLFMAKKVIVAQGGSIIFSSVEGKGSTFGFSFPIKKLLSKESKK